MAFPVLQDYLARLSDPTRAATSLWLDGKGQAQGRFFNCTMTSAFQPVRDLASGVALAYEGLARSVAPGDKGLSLWKLLDRAASDDESIELDRLCRMLHAINFFRQETTGDADLYLNVHDRLLSAVSSNHGHAFMRILSALGLPADRIVLQLPAVGTGQGWLLGYVADNYRRNGFRLALNVSSLGEGLELLERFKPAAMKVDARHLNDAAALSQLLELAGKAGVALIFKRVESQPVADMLACASRAAAVPVHVQGYLFDLPRAIVGDPAISEGSTRVDLQGQRLVLQ